VTTRLYTVNDGLPVSTIYHIRQDKFGYLWVGTPNGLSRFDGRQFVNFDLADGLPSMRIGGVFQDSHDRFWVSTRNGMCQLLGNRFKVYPLSHSGEVGYIMEIIETSFGKIWAVTTTGVYQFEDSVWKRIELYFGFEKRPCRQIVEFDSGLYINYGSHIVYRNAKKEWRLIAENESGYPYYNAISKYNERIFVSTRNAIYRIEDEQLKPVIENLKGEGYFTFLIDSKERLWHIFQEGNSSINVSLSGKMDREGMVIPNKYGIISGIYEDVQENIWVATQEGLLKILESPFNNIVERKDRSVGGVGAISLPDSNLLLLIQDAFYLCYFDKRKKDYQFKFLLKELGPIDCFTKGEQEDIWLVTRSKKLFRYKKGQLKDFTYLFLNSKSESFYGASFDKQKQRLFFCGDSTLLVGNDKGIRPFIPANTGNPLPPCRQIMTRINGQMLLSVNGHGVFYIDRNDKLIPVLKDSANKFYLMLFEDRDENIWVADEGFGLRQFRLGNDGNAKMIATISEKDGLQDNTIYSITTDALNRMWVVTGAGLDILQKNNKNTWEVFNYSKNINLDITDWLFSKLTKDTNGDILLSSWHRLLKFDVQNIFLKKEAPRVIIENVQLNLRDIDWRNYTDSLYSYQQFPVHPKMRYAENTVSLYYNGISFSSSPRLEYSYQLLPFDTLWSQPNTNASVSFVNLLPGTYTFKVRVKDQASEWSEPAMFTFAIISPFWMSWWFISLCIIAVASIIYISYKYRINNLRRLMTMRAKISQDLHDEIGSTLTSINILSKVSQNNLENDRSKASDLLQKITDQSANMQQSMSDIVWSIRPDNDKMENLVIRMREYLGRTAEPKDLQVEFYAEDRILTQYLSMSHRQHILLIFKEAVNNAVKYSSAKKLSIFFGRLNNNIKLSIKDNGVGFKKGQLSYSSGLKNMHTRAKELSGTLQVISETGEGTEIELIFPTT